MNDRVLFFRMEALKKVKKMHMLYLFLILPVCYVLLFHYVPMYGVLIAFKDYRFVDGIWGSSWNNFEHFRMLFSSESFAKVFRNTVVISFLRILLGFPAPLILALLLNEVRHSLFKKTIQSISYLPIFMSWVVLSGILYEVFSTQRGPVNYIITQLGFAPIDFYTNSNAFVSMIIMTGIWREVGFAAVVYLAAITAVNPELYEACDIDGGNRYHRLRYVTLPSIMPVVIILFILGIGGVMNAGFEQIFNMYNPLVYNSADILDTYVYRTGLMNGKFDYGAAVGLFKNVIAIILLLAVNGIARKYTQSGIW